jgi:glycosyltransferase involved in cell wall biosynthesis
LERRARDLGIADRVHFLGPLANIAACEAMACARPVIAARTGGLPEVVRDGETGYLVAPGDAGALAEHIGALIDDAALRQRLGAAGRAWALEMFTWEKVVERVVECYERALAGSVG